MSEYSVSSDDFALVAATAKTVLRFNAGSGRKAKLVRFSVTDGLAGSTDQGIKYRVLTGGTDGTGTAYTPVPLGHASPSNGTAKVVYTVEPTGSPAEVLVDGIPSGAKDTVFPNILVAASGAIAIELTSAQARASGVVVVVAVFEEL